MQQRIRILIADDHPMLRMGVRFFLQSKKAFDIVGESLDGDQTIEMTRRLKPDTVLLDLVMPGQSGMEVLRQLNNELTSTRHILLTAGIEKHQLAEALQLGARGVVLKDSPQAELVEAIREVTAGRYWIDPRIVAELATVLSDSVESTDGGLPYERFALTARELQALAPAIEGCASVNVPSLLWRTDSPLRILIADTTPKGSHTILSALDNDSRFGRKSILANTDVIGQSVREIDPHVAIVGVGQAPREGFSLLQALSRYPRVKSVALLDCTAPDLVVEAFRSGARGVVRRGEPMDVLCNCLAAVHSGKVWTSNDQLASVLGFLSRRWSPQTVVDSRGNDLLSRRELDVVRCVADGMTNRDIASHLSLSEHTVKNYLFRIFDKLGVSNRTELVLYALHHDGGTGMQPYAASQVAAD